MDVFEGVSLVILGLGVGAYGTLIGVGGGFLIVPALLLIYHFSPQHAVGTSLTVVLLNAVSGTISYARLKRIDYITGAKFGVATLPGAAGGAYLTSYLSSRLFYTIFGILLLALAIFLLVRPEAAPRVNTGGAAEAPKPGHTYRMITDAHGTVHVYGFNERTGIIMSFFIGFLSSMLGIGGGIIHVPALVHLFNFPAHIATATSQFILTASATMGAASHLALGNVLVVPALLLGAGVIVGAQVGAALSTRLQGRWLIRLLGIALIVVGFRLLASGLL